MERSQEELEASNNGGSSPNKITGSVDEEVLSSPPLYSVFLNFASSSVSVVYL